MTTSQIAQGLAGLGRGGDSVLVHMQPQEVAGLQAIAQANGTSLTTNPDTGMPEAFSLGGFFKNLLPTIAGFAAAGMSGGAMSPMVAGILAGSATGALTNKKDPLMGAVMGGIGGYGGSSLYGSAVNPALAGQTTTKELIKNSGVDPSLLVPGTASTPSAGMGFDFSNLPAGQGVQLSQAGNPAQYMSQMGTDAISKNMLANAPSNFAATPAAIGGTGVKAGTADLTAGIGQGGLQNAFSNIAQDPMAFLSQNKMGVGMPLAMAGLAGLEPPTPGMTQEEFDAERRRKYNQPLNLNQDTGLRLAAAGGEMRLAGGGAIAFDDGGSVPGSRLSLRREEEQMAPQQMMQPAQTELGIAALKPNQENEVSISIQGAQPNPMQQQQQQVQPLAARTEGEGIPAALQQLGGEGVNFEKLYGRTQAPAPMAPSMQPSMGFGPDGRRLAAGGAIQTGGVMDLYQGTDSQPSFGGNQGYGLGRLNNLAQQQPMNNAEQGRFARGGVPKLEDGGFVVPADVTFYLGNHNTEAGQKRLAQMYGGQPIKGPGSGLSDSIPTSIEGKQPARIANGEVYIPRKAVMAHGGPQKFYKMMDKVRKKATGSTKQAKAA